MALPKEAFRFDYKLDPTDLVEFALDLTPMIPEGQTIASVIVGPASESAGLGFRVADEAPHLPTRPSPTALQFFCNVDEGFRDAAVWTGDGQDCAVEVTIFTDSTAFNRVQRSALIRVKQQ